MCTQTLTHYTPTHSYPHPTTNTHNTCHKTLYDEGSWRNLRGSLGGLSGKRTPPKGLWHVTCFSLIFPTLCRALPYPMIADNPYSTAVFASLLYSTRAYTCTHKYFCRLSREIMKMEMYQHVEECVSAYFWVSCCERCLLIREGPKTPGHYRYLIWVLVYIPYTGLAVFSLRFFVFLCILRFRIFKVRVLNASE